MKPDESPEERTCPVCGTRLPDDADLRRCPRCGARALPWAPERPLPKAVVLFNARLAGIMGGVLFAMLSLLVLGYRFPIPWGVALVTIALPIGGYVAFGSLARKVPTSWRTQYMVSVLAANAGLLAATIAAVLGLIRPVPLLVIIAAGAAVTWPVIHRAVTESNRGENE